MSIGGWRGQRTQLAALLVFQLWKLVLLTASFHDDLRIRKHFPSHLSSPKKLFWCSFPNSNSLLGQEPWGQTVRKVKSPPLGCCSRSRGCPARRLEPVLRSTGPRRQAGRTLGDPARDFKGSISVPPSPQHHLTLTSEEAPDATVLALSDLSAWGRAATQTKG